jgi:hypothetical protein
MLEIRRDDEIFDTEQLLTVDDTHEEHTCTP